MAHAFVTIVAPVSTSNIPTVRSAIDKLKNPAGTNIAKQIDELRLIHFASLNVFVASAGRGGHLVLEFSADGTQDELITIVASKTKAYLGPIFAKAEDFTATQDLADYWRSKVVTVGQGYFSTPGLVFTGTPGMSVDRILKESELAKKISGLVSSLLPTHSALDALQRVREKLRQDKSLHWAWDAETTPLIGAERPFLPALLSMAGRGFAKYLWPLGLAPAAAAVTDVLIRKNLLEFFVVFLFVLLLEIVGTAALVYRFLQTEQSDVPEDGNPTSATMADLAKREDHFVQNHLDVHTVLKSGPLRKTTLRIAFYVIGQFCQRQFKPGFLGSIGSIHFARWVLVPGTQDLLFFSNYGGSWESYLEDFITKAHAGLTGVWSNTIGFPRTSFLFLHGATDGDRFKRWARRKQVATPFWYSAYRHLTTSNIRANAMIRQGLAGASTEDEAKTWLSLFGSAPRPENSLEADEIQSLLFGGLSPFEESECVLFRLGPTGSAADVRDWLSHVLPSVTFGERLPDRSALILGLTRSFLEQCEIPADAIATFPIAFQQGMTEPSRSRILGDSDQNDPVHWSWGGPRNAEFDGTALLYGKTKQDLDSAKQEFRLGLQKFGHGVVQTIPLKSSPRYGERKEPFGFQDGISQPIIRGTFRSRRPFDKIHLVEPGEFILGYVDNRGYVPPTPQIAPTLDPGNVLALVPGSYDAQLGFSNPLSTAARDLGRNGSFLVIRQLEQNVSEFNKFLQGAASLIPGYAGAVPAEEYIAAKLLGRWRDGSSLVRNPSFPASHKPRGSTALQGQGSASAEPDNGFLFGEEDPQGLRCPYGAHIRRANPRDSFAPGSDEQIAITNRHRILRSGRRYEDEGEQGLLFVCLNADFERQFEFIQQTWVLNPHFHGLSDESDPLFRGNHSGYFTVPSSPCPLRITGLQSFVRVRGGGYFFLPGKRTLLYLTKPL